MPLAEIMFEQLAAARRIVEDDQEVVPSWRIATPEGELLIFTLFENEITRREQTLLLVSRFMAWKLATSFVLTAETWLGPEDTRPDNDALMAVGVSRYQQLALMQRIRRGGSVSFAPPERLDRQQVDEAYLRLLPSGRSELTIEEVTELVRIFGEDGELAAEQLS
jgi:hypothetical protein